MTDQPDQDREPTTEEDLQHDALALLDTDSESAEFVDSGDEDGDIETPEEG